MVTISDAEMGTSEWRASTLYGIDLEIGADAAVFNVNSHCSTEAPFQVEVSSSSSYTVGSITLIFVLNTKSKLPILTLSWQHERDWSKSESV